MILPDQYRGQVKGIAICYEDWTFGKQRETSKEDRIWFTLYSTGLQFLLPLVIITIVYWRIYRYIKVNRVQQSSHLLRKQRRTNIILCAIAVIFCLSWLPFSAFCILSELTNIFQDKEVMMMVYCMTHILGMSSSCTNPILYAFLNQSFLQEFHNIFPCLKSRLYSNIGVAVKQTLNTATTPLRKLLNQGVQVEVYSCSDIYSSTRPISDMYTCSRSEAFRCPRSRLSSEDECELPSIYQKHRKFRSARRAVSRNTRFPVLRQGSELSGMSSLSVESSLSTTPFLADFKRAHSFQSLESDKHPTEELDKWRTVDESDIRGRAGEEPDSRTAEEPDRFLQVAQFTSKRHSGSFRKMRKLVSPDNSFEAETVMLDVQSVS